MYAFLLRRGAQPIGIGPNPWAALTWALGAPPTHHDIRALVLEAIAADRAARQTASEADSTNE